MSRLWMSIEPRIVETRLMLTVAPCGTALRARLPLLPAHPRAISQLLEAVAAWFGEPLCAVLDAEGEDVQRHPDRWTLLLGDLDERVVRVEWTALSPPLARGGRDRFLGQVGEFERAKRLVTLAATGQR